MLRGGVGVNHVVCVRYLLECLNMFRFVCLQHFASCWQVGKEPIGAQSV